MTHPLAPLARSLASHSVRYVLTAYPAPICTDLTLVMKGFEFEGVWTERRVFNIDGADVPTARLCHIVESTTAAARLQDQLFLTTHKDALEQLLKKPDGF